MSTRINRRQFLKQAALLSSSAAILPLLAACGATPTTAPAPPTSVPTKAPVPPTATPVPPTATKAPPTVTPMPKPTGELRLNNGSEPANLDASVVDSTGWGILRQIHRPLVMFDKSSSKLVPGLATSWERSADGSTYTFKLRKGVKWHKGYGEFTSDDVKFTIERCKDPATKSLWKSTADTIAEVETPDPYTAVFKLKEPQFGFLYQLVDRMGWILSRKAVTDLKDNYGRNPIGTGPFVFEKWEPKGYISLVANPDYYEPGLPRVARVTTKFVFENAAVMMAFMAGDFDCVGAIGFEDFKRLREAKDRFKVSTVPVTGVTHVEINTKIPPMDKLEVRQALAHAIDYDAVNLANGEWVRNTSHLTPAFGCYREGFPPSYSYDIDKAKELLAKAGFPNGIDVELWGSQAAYHIEMCTAIEASWRKAGIRAKVEFQSNSVMTSKRRAGECMTWTDKWVRPPDENQMWWDKFHSSGYAPGKLPFFGVEEMLEAGRREMDPVKRCEIYQKLDKFVSYDTVQSIPVGTETRYNAQQNWVSEFYDNGLEYGFFWEYIRLNK